MKTCSKPWVHVVFAAIRRDKELNQSVSAIICMLSEAYVASCFLPSRHALLYSILSSVAALGPRPALASSEPARKAPRSAPREARPRSQGAEISGIPRTAARPLAQRPARSHSRRLKESLVLELNSVSSFERKRFSPGDKPWPPSRDRPVMLAHQVSLSGPSRGHPCCGLSPHEGGAVTPRLSRV